MTTLVLALVAVPWTTGVADATSEPIAISSLPTLSTQLRDALADAAPDEPVEVVVKMDDWVTADDLQRALDAGLGIMAPLHTMPVFAVRGTKDQVYDFLYGGGVELAEWNYPLEYMLDTAHYATRANSVWGNTEGQGGPLTLPTGDVVDGTGVGIAIVDGGVDATHPDLLLGEKTAANWKYVCGSPFLVHTGTDRCFANSDVELVLDLAPGENPDLDACREEAGQPEAHYTSLWVDAPSSDTSSGHGTHVAGIAAGSGTASDELFKGVAPGATIYGVGVGEAIALYGTMEAFDWIACMHDKVTPPIKIANNSWGTSNLTDRCNVGPMGVLEREMNDLLVSLGVTVVYAAGNSGDRAGFACTSPQVWNPTPGIIGVANYFDGARGNADGVLQGSSSRGLASDKNTWADLSAPGHYLSATRSNTAQTSYSPAFVNREEARSAAYFQLSGTSMASPYVAGVAALVLQANPSLTPGDVEFLLEDTAHQFTAGQAYTSDPNNPSGHTTSRDKGHGLVDARAAVLAAAAGAGTTLGDTAGSSFTGNTVLYPSTAVGLGNAELDYFNLREDAPTKTQPSVWHDVHMVIGIGDKFQDHFYWVPSLKMHGDVDIANQDLHLRWFADAVGSTAFRNTLIPDATDIFEVTVAIGDFVYVAGDTVAGADVAAPEATKVTNGLLQYDLVIPGVTAQGSSIMITWDARWLDTSAVAVLAYDSVHYPTSLGIGAPAADAEPLPEGPPTPSVGDGTVCNMSTETPTCFETIQEAIDAAAAGDEITAFDTFYPEAIDVNKAVTLNSALGSLITIVEAPAGQTTLTVSADGATVEGFWLTNAAPSSSDVFADVQANDVVLRAVDVVEDVGTAMQFNAAGVPGLDDISLVENSFLRAGVGVDVAGNSDVALVGNLLRAADVNVQVAAGDQPVSFTGNNFANALVHVTGDAARVDAPHTFEHADSTFDGAVLVEGVNTIYGTIQGAMADASANGKVVVREGTYEGPVAIPPTLGGLTLCASQGAADCDAMGPVATITGAQGLVVRANDVTVRGFNIQANAAPATAVDAGGRTNFVFEHNRIEAGPVTSDGTFLADTLPAAFAQGETAAYLNDPFVADVLGSDALEAIRADHASDAGLLSVVPTTQGHVALAYTGVAPAGVTDGVEHGLPVKVVENVETRTLKEEVTEDQLDIEMVSNAPDGPMLPGAAQGIGPGSHLLITDPAAAGGQSWRCTASFVFEDKNTGDLYLNTAGHCVTAAIYTGTDDPNYQQPQRFRVCIADCFITSVNGGTLLGGQYVDFDANPVLYARTELAGQQFGEDFAFVKIPARFHDLVRPWEWFWGGPLGLETGNGLGEPVVHYGHGLVTGETYATEARAGIGIGNVFSGGANAFNAVGWATGGDSGSAVLTATARSNALFGNKALGDLTHSIIVVGAPTFVGTRATHAVNVAEQKTGVDLELLAEDAFAQEVAAHVVGLTMTGSTDVTLNENVLRIAGGGCGLNIEEGELCPHPVQSTGINAGHSVGAQITGNEITGEVLSPGDETALGATNGILGAYSGATIAENTISGWSANGLFMFGADTEVTDNVFTRSNTGLLVCNGADRLDARGNTFRQLFTAVIVCGSTPGPADVTLRSNDFDLLSEEALQLNSDTTGLTVDARLNQWNVPSYRLLELKVNDQGTDNRVLLTPYIALDGSTQPPTPTVDGSASHSATPATCNAHPDAFHDGTKCVFLTVQAAIDFAHPGQTVLVPAASGPDPAPRVEAITIDQNNIGEDLDGLTLCSTIGAGLCAVDVEPGHWEWNGAGTGPAWMDAPGGKSGQALRIEDVGSTSLFPPEGFQIDDLESLSHDVFVEAGACGGGSPRVTFGIDTDLDGMRDGNVYAYTSSNGGCPTMTWFRDDIFADPATSWASNVFGGPSSGTQSDAHAALLAVNPDYEIAAINVQWDAAPATVWLDDLRVNGFYLGEAEDASCFFGGTCRWEDATANTVIDAQGLGTATVEMVADDLRVAGLTLKNTGTSGSPFQALTTSGDRAVIEGNVLEGNVVGQTDLFGNQEALRVLGGDDYVIRDNQIRFWDNMGIIVLNSNSGDGLIEGNLIEFNTNHAIYVGGSGPSTTVEIRDNTIGPHDDSAVRVVTDRHLLMRYNDLSGARATKLHFASSVTDPNVDARLNHWGIVGRDAIPMTFVFDGAEQDVPYMPYLDAVGGEHPPFPHVYCFIGGLLTEVGTTIDLQEAVDVPLASLDPGCDTTQRSIVLDEDFEAHDGATVDSKVTVLGNVVGGPNGVTRPVLARVLATDTQPGLAFEAGSEGSSVIGLNLELREGATGITADGLAADIDVEASKFLAVGVDHATGVAASNGEAPDVTDSSFRGAITALDLVDTTGGSLADSSATLQLDAGQATAPLVRLLRSNGATIEAFTANGNLYPGSVAIRVEDSTGTVIRDSSLVNAGTGLYVPGSTGLSLEGNDLVLPPLSQFGSPALGVSFFGGSDHTLTGNVYVGEGNAVTVSGTPNVVSDGDTWAASLAGVIAKENGATQPTGLVVTNGNLATTEIPLTLGSGTVGLSVFAECNDWGAYHAATIATTRIDDQGTLNTVDFQPWVSADADNAPLGCLTPPLAAFTAAPNPTVRDEEVSFTDQSQAGSRPILAREWDFGDGSPAATGEEATHTYTTVGQFTARLTVTDTDGQEGVAVNLIDVQNQLPVFDPLSDQDIVHGLTLSFTVHAEDNDDDTLTYSASNLPAGSSFDPSTQVFTWATTVGDIGTYPGVTFSVDDGFDTVDQVITIDVIDNPPVLDPIGNQATKEAFQLAFGVSATDVDGDAITLAATGLPSGASFTDNGDGTGDFDWTPQVGDQGTYTVTFTATSLALSDSETITIDVGEFNIPPVVDAPALVEALPGDTVSITATASDADGDALTWSLSKSSATFGASFTVAPDGLSATFVWTIPVSQTQDVLLTFTVDDGIDQSSDATSLELLQVPSSVVLGVKGPCNGQLVSGKSVLLRGGGFDGDGTIVSATFYPEGLGGPSVPGTPFGPEFRANHVYAASGTYTVVFEVVDDDGLTSTSTRTVTVNDNQVPTVNAGDDVAGNATGPSGLRVTLAGSAGDPEGCPFPAGAFKWVLPASAGGGTLTGATVNRNFPVGDHLVTLEVTDAFGGVGTDTMRVVVDDDITASAVLDGATQDSDGVYQVNDPDTFLLGTMSGSVDVLSDLGLGVEGAQVTGVVTYYGLEPAPVGLTVAEFDGQTDANGHYDFVYLHDVLGAAGYAGVATMPGYHEIELTVTADSRAGAPVDDLETETLTVRYFVAPAGPQV